MRLLFCSHVQDDDGSPFCGLHMINLKLQDFICILMYMLVISFVIIFHFDDFTFLYM